MQLTFDVVMLSWQHRSKHTGYHWNW